MTSLIGYAPGDYYVVCECGKHHTADKRSWMCFECAINLNDKLIEVLASQIEELYECPYPGYDLPTSKEIIKEAMNEAKEAINATEKED